MPRSTQIKKNNRVPKVHAWQWYASFKSKGDLNLPAIAVDPQGFYKIHCNEIFCRVPGCPKEAPLTSTNNLRKHYRRHHPEIKLISGGGRPTLAEEQAAVEFYKALYNAHLAQPGKTAAVPIKIEDEEEDEHVGFGFIKSESLSSESDSA